MVNAAYAAEALRPRPQSLSWDLQKAFLKLLGLFLAVA